MVIAGNKIDLKKFDVDKEEVLKFSEEQGAKHFYTSAKTGEGLDEIFMQVTKQIAIKGEKTNPVFSKTNKKITIGKNGGSSNDNISGGCCK